MGQIAKDGSYIAPEGLVLSDAGKFESISNSESSKTQASAMNESIEAAINSGLILGIHPLI